MGGEHETKIGDCNLIYLDQDEKDSDRKHTYIITISTFSLDESLRVSLTSSCVHVTSGARHVECTPRRVHIEMCWVNTRCSKPHRIHFVVPPAITTSLSDINMLDEEETFHAAREGFNHLSDVE